MYFILNLLEIICFIIWLVSCTTCRPTAELESFHNHILMYCTFPRSLDYNIKSTVPALDHRAVSGAWSTMAKQYARFWQVTGHVKLTVCPIYHFKCLISGWNSNKTNTPCISIQNWKSDSIHHGFLRYMQIRVDYTPVWYCRGYTPDTYDN